MNKHFGSVRYAHNYFLNQRKEEYLNNKKSITYNQQPKILTQLKTDDETGWLKETNSQSLQYSLKCLAPLERKSVDPRGIRNQMVELMKI